MSWVPNAIKHIEAQDHEVLHQTVWGGYGTKPNIFWAIDPKDMPVALRENVEETVKDDAVGESRCAIIRLETLPAYHDEELQATGNPVACFTVYIGTHGSDVVYDRQINIYGDRKPVTPKDGRPESLMWGEIEGNAISRRLRKMSVTMGWSEPPPMIRRESSAIAGGGSPIRAPTAQRHMSLAVPDLQYRTEAASKRFSRKMSLRADWMDAQSNSVSTRDTGESALAATLAALEGSSSTPTSSHKFPERPVPESAENAPRNVKRISVRNKRTSLYADIPEANHDHFGNVQNYFQDSAAKPGATLSTQRNSLFNDHMNDHEYSPAPAVDIHLTETAEVTSRRVKRMSTKRISVYLEREITEVGEIPPTPSQMKSTALDNALAALEGTPTPREQLSLPQNTDLTTRKMKRMSAKRMSQFIQDDIPEIEELPMINFQTGPSQVDTAALNDTLAALEGTRSPVQESHSPGIPEVTPRRMKRMSAKRVSLFLEDDIPEVGEPEFVAQDEARQASAHSHHRKASVQYALAALEAPTPIQANIGKPRRPDAVVRSRKTMSMYLESSPGSITSHGADHFPEPRSFFDTDPPDTEYESTSQKLKRMSWNVIGRALPQTRQTNNSAFPFNIQEHPLAPHHVEPTSKKLKRASWLPTRRVTPEPPASSSNELDAALTWDQPTLKAQAQRRVEPVPRKNNRSSWYSMDPSVAEIQCSPRKEYGPPAPWLEPVVQPASAVEPATGTTRKGKRTSWYPAARKVQPQPQPPSPLRETSPVTTDVLDESPEDAKSRKKMNRMSRFVFPQGSKKQLPEEVFAPLGGPLNSHPASCTPSRPGTPIKTPHMSKMKKFGAQIGRLFR